MSKIKAQMHPAYMWDCEECGGENFERAMRPCLSEEEIAELRDEHGVQPWEEGELLTYPDSVTCRHCQSTFETEHD